MKKNEIFSFYCGEYFLPRRSSAAWWSYETVTHVLKKNLTGELYLHGFLCSLKQKKESVVNRREFILETKDLKKLSERLRIDERSLKSMLKRMRDVGFINFFAEKKEGRNRKIKFRLESVPEIEKKLGLLKTTKRFMTPLWVFDETKAPLRKARGFFYGVYEEIKKQRKIFYLSLFKNVWEKWHFNEKAIKKYSIFAKETKLSPWSLSYLDVNSGNEVNFGVESSALSTTAKDLNVSISVVRKLRKMAEKIKIIKVRRNLNVIGQWNDSLYSSIMKKNNKLFKKIIKINDKMVFCGTSCVQTNESLRRAMMTWNMDKLLSHFGRMDARCFGNVFFPQDENGKKIETIHSRYPGSGADYVASLGGCLMKEPLYWTKKNLVVEKKRLVAEALSALQKECEKRNLKFFKEWLLSNDKEYHDEVSSNHCVVLENYAETARRIRWKLLKKIKFDKNRDVISASLT